MRIAISGSAGSGKTSFVELLSKKLNLPVVGEQYDLFFEKKGRYISPKDRLREKIKWLLEEKHQQELKHASFISDRCPIDLFNLWMTQSFHTDKGQTDIIYNSCINYIQKYDALILLPWDDIPLKQVTDQDSKRRRVMKPWVQFRHHSTIVGIAMQWFPLDRILAIPKHTGDAACRCDYAISALNRIVKS
ncbi:MAG: AAA family ATPase [Pseudomonadales bacterium]|nr:AAA family ATPase [Pseudomonadales bacterium]